jgi:hypothetical protein
MSVAEDLKLEEYRSLLEEHRRNRSYIFERPIIILGLVGVATQYFYNSNIGQFILAVLIFLLCFNLWFTGNRLQSDARIVAYLQLVHEGELRENWFGWESALRDYRRWVVVHTKNGDIEELIKNEIDREAVPDSVIFYSGIHRLHIVIVLVAFCAALIRWYEYKSILENVGLFASATTTIIFIIYAFGPLYPNKLNASIERERAKWKFVFREFSGNNPWNS